TTSCRQWTGCARAAPVTPAGVPVHLPDEATFAVRHSSGANIEAARAVSARAKVLGGQVHREDRAGESAAQRAVEMQAFPGGLGEERGEARGVPAGHVEGKIGRAR